MIQEFMDVYGFFPEAKGWTKNNEMILPYCKLKAPSPANVRFGFSEFIKKFRSNKKWVTAIKKKLEK